VSIAFVANCSPLLAWLSIVVIRLMLHRCCLVFIHIVAALACPRSLWQLEVFCVGSGPLSLFSHKVFFSYDSQISINQPHFLPLCFFDIFYSKFLFF
jgi:hypothetical protein